MSSWMLAVLAMLPAFVVPVVAAFRGRADARFVALQFATAITVPVLVLMTFAFDQPALIDLALALAILSLAGTLTLALFLERWL